MTADGHALTVHIRLFASYAESIGRSSFKLEFPPGSTVRTALAAVTALSAASSIPPAPLIAVNLVYAPLTTILKDGDEVAFIPPVAGG